MKKILKHLSLWGINRKPTPRAIVQPTEAFIIYDESSSPGTDDPPSLQLFRCDKLPDPPAADYSIETHL